MTESRSQVGTPDVDAIVRAVLRELGQHGGAPPDAQPTGAVRDGDLVIDLPDGSQMVIVDGAVFVPQLVLGGVELPATNLAALLIDSEPAPASGTPQSGGGNFGLPPGPLDSMPFGWSLE